MIFEELAFGNRGDSFNSCSFKWLQPSLNLLSSSIPTSCTCNRTIVTLRGLLNHAFEITVLPANIAVETYTIEHAPTESKVGGAILFVNKKEMKIFGTNLTFYRSFFVEVNIFQVIMHK